MANGWGLKPVVWPAEKAARELRKQGYRQYTWECIGDEITIRKYTDREKIGNPIFLVIRRRAGVTIGKIRSRIIGKIDQSLIEHLSSAVLWHNDGRFVI